MKPEVETPEVEVAPKPQKVKPVRKAKFTYVLAPISFATTIFFASTFLLLALLPAVLVVGVVAVIILWLLLFLVMTVGTVFLIWFSPDFWNFMNPNGGSFFDGANGVFGFIQKAAPVIIVLLVLTFIATLASFITTWILLIIGKANNKKSPLFTVLIILFAILTAIFVMLFILVVVILVILIIKGPLIS